MKIRYEIRYNARYKKYVSPGKCETNRHRFFKVYLEGKVGGSFIRLFYVSARLWQG